VFVTGTFDDWGKTVKLNRVGDTFEKEVSLPAGEKIQYKVCSLILCHLLSYHFFPSGAIGKRRCARCGESGCLEAGQPQLCMTLHPSADVTWPVPLSQKYKTSCATPRDPRLTFYLLNQNNSSLLTATGLLIKVCERRTTVTIISTTYCSLKRSKRLLPRTNLLPTQPCLE